MKKRKQNKKRKLNKKRLILTISVIVGTILAFVASYFLLGLNISIILFIGIGLMFLIGMKNENL